MVKYAQGGYIEPGWVAAGQVPLSRCVIHPDECFVRAEDVRSGRWKCGRPGHPTAASDCSPK